MVELVFVILMIGILAAVAIPRLAATRDDAKMSTIAHNIMVGATDIAAFAVSKGYTENDLSRMSQAIKTLVDGNDASSVSGQPEIRVHWGGINNCVTLKILNQGANTETLVIDANGSSTNAQCDKLRQLIDTSRFPMPLHGTLISI